MKSLIILNGDKPSDELLKECGEQADFIICADGAFLWAKNRVRVDYLIGDMDSIGENVEELLSSIKAVTRLPREKDETDAFAAVTVCLERGAEQIVMLGALGQRFDHTMGNIQILQYLQAAGIKASIEDDLNSITCIGMTTEFSGWKGKLLSIIPISDTCIVSTRGLKYPLFKAALSQNIPLGISNEFTEDSASVEIHTGRCLVVLPK